ncbi:MAG: hypothetical protein WCU88_11035 [Elusimicrobiota bacterium]|jgi:hypothetical protein
MSSNQESSSSSLLLAAVFFAMLTAGAALFILMKQQRPDSEQAKAPASAEEDAGSRSSLFPKREDDRARLPDPSAPLMQDAGKGLNNPLWNEGAPGPRRNNGSGAARGTPERGAARAPAAAAPTKDQEALAAAGGPATPEQARNLGADKSAFSALFQRLAKHPQILHALLNNKAVVKGFLDRSGVRENCSSTQSMQKYLSGPGLAGKLPSYLDFLHRNPGTAQAIAGTELAGALMDCPGARGVLSSPAALQQISSASPAFTQLVTDPSILQALSSDPNSLAAFSNIQGAVGRSR